METIQDGPYYIVHDKHEEDDVSLRFIVAEFSRRRDASEFAQTVGGDIVTLADGGDISELVEAWHAGDFSRQAHHEAGEELAVFFHDLGNVALASPEDLDLAGRYATADPLCAAYLRAVEIIAEAKAVVLKAVPPHVERFHGVHIRGEWKPSPEVLAEIEARKAAMAGEAVEAN